MIPATLEMPDWQAWRGQRGFYVRRFPHPTGRLIQERLSRELASDVSRLSEARLPAYRRCAFSGGVGATDAVSREFAAIPVARWGQDHWSTLAYIESRCVDHYGVLDNNQLRVHERRHRVYVYSHPVMGVRTGGSKYPTRLNDGEVESHDDIDCVLDMQDAGYLDVICDHWLYQRNSANAGIPAPHRRMASPFPGWTLKVALTPEGQRIAGLLRSHKMDGGVWRDFRVPAGQAAA